MNIQDEKKESSDPESLFGKISMEEATINIQKRAHRDIHNALVGVGTPDARPTPSIGWKIDLKNTDGTPWIGRDREPGWTTYSKEKDTKSVFSGKEYPADFPKVAATLRHIKSLGVPTQEEYGTELLTTIVHKIETLMREHGKSGKGTWYKDGLNITIFQENGPETCQGLRINTGDKEYKIILTQQYDRANHRHAWSMYIDTSDTETYQKNSNSRTGRNFKLAPVGDSFFSARLVKENNAFAPELALDSTDIALLKKVSDTLR